MRNGYQLSTRRLRWGDSEGDEEIELGAYDGGGGLERPIACKAHEDFDKVLEGLGLAMAHDRVYRGDDLIGRYRVLFLSDPIITCECLAHTSCKFSLNARARWDDKQAACLQWLVDGLHKSPDQHLQAQADVKTLFGVRVRKARP